jgi:hypothetical protein
VRADAFGHLALAPGADEIDLDGDRRAAVELVLLRQVEPQLRQHPRVAAPPVERPQQVLLSALVQIHHHHQKKIAKTHNQKAHRQRL